MADGPANNPNNPIEETYTHMINKAREYIYCTTPYLVLDQKTDAVDHIGVAGIAIFLLSRITAAGEV